MTSVKVAVRVRPFSPKEVTDRTNKIIEMDGPSTIITDPAWFERKETLDELTAEDTEYLYKKRFTFDHSFWSFSGNRRTLFIPRGRFQQSWLVRVRQRTERV